MDPVLRLRYLDAMGIQQYVARMPMPGAKPSPSLALVTATETETAGTSQTTTAPVVTNTPAPLMADAVKPATTPAAIPDTGTDARPTTQTNAFSCHAAIWTSDDLLVLADITQLSKPVTSLLNDILYAIQRQPVESPVAFRWPIRGLADESLPSAQDYLQGFLEGGPLTRKPISQILAFGDHVRQLIATDSESRFKHWPLLCLPGLDALLQEPAQKAQVWKSISLLARAQ